MPRSEMVNIVLTAMLIAVCVTVIPSMAAGLPANWTSIAMGAVIVAIIAGVVAAALCLITKRGASAA